MRPNSASAETIKVFRMSSPFAGPGGKSFNVRMLASRDELNLNG
jgi:hypothetical protein